MKVLKIIFIVLGAILLLFLATNLFAPKSFNIKSSTTIDAPPSEVFGYVSDFTQWKDWDPRQQQDPNLIAEYELKDEYLGSWWKWKSEVVGGGKQEIIKVDKNEYLRLSLVFDDWDSTNYTEWHFKEVPEGTKVTWTMEGAESPFMMRFMNLFMKPMVKASYDEGLANLKGMLENN